MFDYQSKYHKNQNATFATNYLGAVAIIVILILVFVGGLRFLQKKIDNAKEGNKTEAIQSALSMIGCTAEGVRFVGNGRGGKETSDVWRYKVSKLKRNGRTLAKGATIKVEVATHGGHIRMVWINNQIYER